MCATIFRSCSIFLLQRTMRGEAGQIAIGEGEIMVEDEENAAALPDGRQRLDKWLWYVRIAKTRSLAQKQIEDGRVRVNRERVTKPAQSIKIGDLVSVEVGKRLRLLKVLAPGQRRGPASQAAELYRDLSPLPVRQPLGEAGVLEPGMLAPARNPGAGRPTKRERRRIDRLRDR
jgi:ribosome-associated heat shock protein Hsp15